MSKKILRREPIDRIEADIKFGLTEEQVSERKKKGYANVTVDPNEKSTAKIIAGNLFTFFNTVLFSIAIVFIGFIIYFMSIGRSDIVDKYFGFSKFVFLIPAIMNVAMGSIQEIHSLKVIKNLRIVTETKSRVIRGGKTETLDAGEIVIDDVVALSAGDQATADLLVCEGEVFVDESMLTGESDHVKKLPGDTILSGSSVIVGNAKCRASEVGNDTYAAKLTGKVKSGARHKSELMTSIMKIMKALTVALVVVLITVTITLVIKIAKSGGDPTIWDGLTLSVSDPLTWGLIVLTGGSFGIGIIPSGLVLTTSVALMVSIAQLAKKKTLIQELYSLENLSRIDVICLDKTGTLTDGTMNVCDVKYFVPESDIERYAKDLVGTAGERNATMEAVYQKFGINETPDIAETIPFSSATKYSGVVYRDGMRVLMGAPEYLIPAEDERLSFAVECAKDGKRVIALTADGELAAFIVIEDHIRDTAPDTLRFFRENGVTVKVISGDNPLTVSKIAQNCGIKNADRYISLAGVPLEDIPEIAEDYTVFARVSPEQKEALVVALQARGHKVAMTGDGVNDILALRKSDSSITFAKATEAAKSCSDVVLLDNDFSHLKEVVGEGRRVIGNIEKTAVLYLMKSIATIILAFALIPLTKGQMWFQIENMYMLEAAIIGTGGFLLSLEPRRNPIKGAFIKNISYQAIAAGILAAAAILLPIALNALPKYLGLAPYVSDINIRPMMTVMLTIAGFVVVFSMCIPFNKYRTLTLVALAGVAIVLGFMLPSSFVGGHTLGADAFHFNSAAGQTIFDSQFLQELFRPWNSQVIRDFVHDENNFFVLRLFMFIAVPSFILTRFALENLVRKNYGKDVKKGRAFRIARRLMLASGFVLFLRAFISFIEMIAKSRYMVNVSDDMGILASASTAINIFYILSYLVIGYFGYKLWKDPTKRNIKIAFGMAMALVFLSGASVIMSHRLVQGEDLLIVTDNIVILLLTAAYVIGAVIVRANYNLGLLKPRDK
ncbi:MAG: HAD-IC family P-type ATPase [Clostridia bacterium]|nr:HAD-IC family P-type ATPase [Clostridia bacterium]